MNARRQSLAYAPAPPQAGTPILQRRESLVKPTWQNVCPGEISPSTLEKVNGIESRIHDIAQQSNYHNHVENGVTVCSSNTELRRQYSKKNGEVFDIYGKVNSVVLFLVIGLKGFTFMLKGLLFLPFHYGD